MRSKYLYSFIVFLLLAVIAILTIRGINPTNRMLNYPLDQRDQDILRKFMRDELPSLAFDAFWEDLFYYRAVFEDISEDLVNCTPGSGPLCPSTGVGADGLVLNTEAATTNDFADVEKTPLADSGLAWNRKQKMRLGFRVPSVAAQTIYMVRGSTNIASPYYGFKVVNATLKGVSYDNSTETTADLMTISADTSYLVEARYSPGTNIVFSVDGIDRGVINGGLPTGTDSVTRGFYNFRITTTENVGKSLLIAFFEYIQKKGR